MCRGICYNLDIYERDYNKRRARKIISLLPKLKEKRVLDIGCGGGFYSLAAHGKGCKNIIQIDSSPVCVQAAKSNLLENANYDAEGVVADATNLPFTDGYFDFVLCIDLIEHVKEDSLLLREIRRVLRDNGLMLLATQNSNSITYVLEAPIQRYVLKNRNWMGWDPTHIRFYTPKHLLHLLTTSGLTPIEIDGTYFIPYGIGNWLQRLQRLSKAVYRILVFINEKMESKRKALWNLFGWGIICLSIKRT